MKKVILATLVLFIGFSLSGCVSPKYEVKLTANPYGAEIICNGTRYGKSKTYSFNKELVYNRSMDFSDCSAHWVSGYTTKYGTLRVQEFPDGATLTAERPYGRGYEKDAQFGLQVETMYAQKRQATYQRLQLEEMKRQGR